MASQGSLDTTAKIKVGVSLAVIVISLLWLGYALGWISFGGETYEPPLTQEELEEIEEEIERETRYLDLGPEGSG